jgi:hypothetical protein
MNVRLSAAFQAWRDFAIARRQTQARLRVRESVSSLLVCCNYKTLSCLRL